MPVVQVFARCNLWMIKVLAAATGQNGLTLGIQADQVKFNQVALIDTNGIAATSYNSKAGLVIAGNSTNPFLA